MHVIAGLILSSTVTTDVQVAVLLLLSVTDRVTVFVSGLDPKLLQLSVVLSMLNDFIPQISFDPLSICAALIVAFPLASSCTVIFLQMAVGGVLSITVTTALHSLKLPAESVTLNFTVFAPVLLQSKVFGVAVNVNAPEQLSYDPLSMSIPLMVLLPVPSR